MASFSISGIKHSTIDMTKSQSTWTINKNALVSVLNGPAIYEDTARSGNTLINYGELFADNGMHTITVHLDGFRTDVRNAVSGVVTGQTGFRLGGDRQTMSNLGEIDVSDTGIAIYGMQTSVTNGGIIRSDGSGIEFINAQGATAVNGLHGKIIAQQIGISYATDAGISTTFTNLGQLTSKLYAISGGAGDEKVINHGTMSGTISLYDGNDTFDNRGGVFHGEVYGEVGDDTLITDRANIKLIESSMEGTDTVKSTVSYVLNDNVEHLFLLGEANIYATGNAVANVIHGNNGNNVIKGMQGDDQLHGHKGNDVLIGNFNSDTFYFATGDGHDIIQDFQDGSDTINLSGWNAITSFSDLKAHHLSVDGDDLIISAGQDSLTLKHVDKAALDAMDFVLF